MADTDLNPGAQINLMDQEGVKETTVVPAQRWKPGFVIRVEPASHQPQEYVLVAACELMARDIGRYIRFVRRLGNDSSSANVVIAELRQIYFTSDQVHLTLGACAVVEYTFAFYDLLAVYGDGVSIDTLLEDQIAVDHQGPKKV